MYYRRIHEPKEGEEVQYLAVYALRWPWDRGIEPTDAFVQVDDPLLKAAPLLLEALKEASQHFYGDMAPDFDYYSEHMYKAHKIIKAAIAAATKEVK